MKKLLLVGGSSFIGKNLIELLEDKYNILVVSRSLDKNFVDKNVKFYKYEFGKDKHISTIIKNESPDYIINLISIVTASRDNKLFTELLNSNIEVLLELYDASKDLNSLKLFINFGSAEEYGNIQPPFKETQREYPNSPYGLVKQLSTNTAIMLNSNYNFPIMVVRPGNVFGKYQNKNKFIPHIVNQLLNNKPIETTPGEQKRDFIYVHDLIHVIDRLLDNYEDLIGKIVNISYGESISLKDIIEFCKSSIGSKSYINYGKLPYRKNEIMDFRCDITRLKQSIDFQFKYSLFEALGHYIRLVREESKCSI